jgi:hypothetical protein
MTDGGRCKWAEITYQLVKPLLLQAHSLPPFLPSSHVPPQADRSPRPSPRQFGLLSHQEAWRLAPLGAR